MHTEQIPFSETGFFTKLIADYIEKKPALAELYENLPDTKGFEQQRKSKEKSFSDTARKTLQKSVKTQYEGFDISKKLEGNITRLSEKNTFTITTGHQLNIMTGPLYFLYKIVTTVNLAKELEKTFPNQNFVPVYWMATEDHDFEEINHFFVHNKKIRWDVECKGPVGRKSTRNIDAVWEVFSKEIGDSQQAKNLKNLFFKAYVEQSTLADATRFLVNELFGTCGLLIVDGDDKNLKQQFAPFVAKELTAQYAKKSMKQTNHILEENYRLQVHPREINLFYMQDDLRERIVLEKGNYRVLNTEKQFTEIEILEKLKKHPENFSPNVVMRPLYQELVLPNLCYVGGGGELAYWLQLKQMFQESNIPFPIVVLRNSVLLISKKQEQKLKKLNISKRELFLEKENLVAKKIKELSAISLDFSAQKNNLKAQFSELKKIAVQTDKSFQGALNAQEKKQLKGLQNLEKKLLKAEKKKHQEQVHRVKLLKESLFPRNGLQERNLNFSEFYLDYGDELIPSLCKILSPLEQKFTVFTLEE
jgi:bacillithiol biosynthesis cysteine-adding enzyme BshC